MYSKEYSNPSLGRNLIVSIVYIVSIVVKKNNKG